MKLKYFSYSHSLSSLPLYTYFVLVLKIQNFTFTACFRSILAAALLLQSIEEIYSASRHPDLHQEK